MAGEFVSQFIKVSKAKPEQVARQWSFVGGRPKLPRAMKLPACKNCGAFQTFFFQVAFPEGHVWEGQTLAVFECTACRDEENPVPQVNKTLVPSMKRMELRRGEDVPDGALDLYQTTCRFPVFPTVEGVMRVDYVERVRYRPIAFEPALEEKLTAKSKLGGKPGWVQGIDLTPGKYLGEPLEFLFQWRHDFEFDRVTGSPPPYHPYMEMVPELADVGQYKLFLGTQLYFFGNQTGNQQHVFMIAMRS